MRPAINITPGQVVYLRDLIFELLARELRLRYEGSFLGVVWSLINPMAKMMVYTILFRYILNFRIENYPAFVFTGILVWEWFSQGLEMAAGSIVRHAGLIRQPGFPSAVLPMVAVLIPLFDFIVSLPILLVFLLFGNGCPGMVILMLPVVMGIQFLLTLGLGFILAGSNVVFRDTNHLLGVLLNLFFFLTPVFYSTDMAGSQFQMLFRLNPMTWLLDAYRTILLQGQAPHEGCLLVPTALALVVIIAGWRIFRHFSLQFAEDV